MILMLRNTHSVFAVCVVIFILRLFRVVIKSGGNIHRIITVSESSIKKVLKTAHDSLTVAVLKRKPFCRNQRTRCVSFSVKLFLLGYPSVLAPLGVHDFHIIVGHARNAACNKAEYRANLRVFKLHIVNQAQCDRAARLFLVACQQIFALRSRIKDNGRGANRIQRGYGSRHTLFALLALNLALVRIR